MKIQDIGRDLGIMSNSAESLQGKNIAPQAEEVASVDEHQAAGEEISISQTSLEYSKAAEAMEVEDPQRAERIQAIKQQIDDGSYQIDAAKVADKMLQEILSE
jgi:negative regulator of flagellin synthesis FlgM